MSFPIENLLKELRFKAVRSSGKGGQNVNKVSSKVELTFDVLNSAFLSEEQKQIILKKLASKINDAGQLKLTTDSERSQYSNKEIVSEKFLALVIKALTPKRKRKHTKPSKQSVEDRLKIKKQKAEKKELRKRVF
jgi:ribosome-associated protein